MMIKINMTQKQLCNHSHVVTRKGNIEKLALLRQALIGQVDIFLCCDFLVNKKKRDGVEN